MRRAGGGEERGGRGEGWERRVVGREESFHAHVDQRHPPSLIPCTPPARLPPSLPRPPAQQQQQQQQQPRPHRAHPPPPALLISAHSRSRSSRLQTRWVGKRANLTQIARMLPLSHFSLLSLPPSPSPPPHMSVSFAHFALSTHLSLARPFSSLLPSSPPQIPFLTNSVTSALSKVERNSADLRALTKTGAAEKVSWEEESVCAG